MSKLVKKLSIKFFGHDPISINLGNTRIDFLPRATTTGINESDWNKAKKLPYTRHFLENGLLNIISSNYDDSNVIEEAEEEIQEVEENKPKVETLKVGGVAPVNQEFELIEDDENTPDFEYAETLTKKQLDDYASTFNVKLDARQNLAAMRKQFQLAIK